MSDNPYRFTVEVERKPGRALTWWVVNLVDRNADGYFQFSSLSEAEANEHAELIRQAMREVS